MSNRVPSASDLRVLFYTATTGLLLCALAMPVTAQVTLVGQIVDNQTGSPIRGANVILLDQQGRWVSVRTVGDDGAFEFTVRREGPYRLRGSRIGFRENTTPRLFLGQHSMVRVELRLDAEAVLLAPLEVVARSPARQSPMLDNFEARRQAGLGTFITREQIEKQRPGRLTDILAVMAGVRLESAGGAGHQRVVYLRATCPAQVFIDGYLLNRPGASIAIDDVVAPKSVHGIEIFGGYATIPAEFLNQNSRCGVVAIWTRRGDGGD